MKENEKKEQKNKAPILLLRNKLLLLVVSFGLLLTLVIVGSVAWFTRVSTVSGITMDVAQFDFKADYQTEEFIINARDYMSNQTKKVGPGSGGIIPLKVSAKNSNTDVDFTISIDFENMAPEFRKRLCFFYWTYENGAYKKNYIASEADMINGTVGGGSEQTEYVYWEWVYELSQGNFFVPEADGAKAHWSSDASEFQALYGETAEERQAAVEAHDEWDTSVGLKLFDEALESENGTTYERSATPVTISAITSPEITTADSITLSAVQNAMGFKILFYGAQVAPIAGDPENPSEEYKAAHPSLFNGYGATTMHAISL